MRYVQSYIIASTCAQRAELGALPMASDRGTMTRATNFDLQAQRAEQPTMAAGRRMPSAPRERKPALAVLAVLLIIGGALAAGALVVKSGHRVGAVEITKTIPQGAPVPGDAITEVQIAADSGVKYIAWQYSGQISQYYATAAIPAGTLLNSGMISKTRSTPNGDAEVGLALKDGQLPNGVKAGDHVAVISTQQSANGGCPGKPGTTLAEGTVTAVAPAAAGTGVTDVQVAIAPGAVGEVACNTANGSLAIAIVSGDTGGSGSSSGISG
jgi:hypothetical protein